MAAAARSSTTHKGREKTTKKTTTKKCCPFFHWKKPAFFHMEIENHREKKNQHKSQIGRLRKRESETQKNEYQKQKPNLKTKGRLVACNDFDFVFLFF
jgi:hypothetical protein